MQNNNIESFTKREDLGDTGSDGLLEISSLADQKISLNSEDSSVIIESDCRDFNQEIKKICDLHNLPSIACRAKNNNPNYLSIIHSNKNFRDIFHIEQADLINKSYDFLFEDVDLDYSSADQVEYTKLIKMVKDFKEHDAIITLYDFNNPRQKI
ncbi:MAG: hypothetical protein RL769_534, partial [Pseudomonadota bacterium]